MKKVISLVLFLFLTLGLIFTLAGCKNTTKQNITVNDIVGNVYEYEKDSLWKDTGKYKFVIYIYEDGTFTYSEGYASNHIVNGKTTNWVLEDNILMLEEKINDSSYTINYFKVDKKGLVYIAKNSNGFDYTHVEDGGRFNIDTERAETIKKVIDKPFWTANNGVYLRLNKNGTFDYSDDGTKSLLLRGNWIIDKNIITLVAKNGDDKRVNYIYVNGEGVFFQEENSNNFENVKLKDGDEFIELVQGG